MSSDLSYDLNNLSLCVCRRDYSLAVFATVLIGPGLRVIVIISADPTLATIGFLHLHNNTSVDYNIPIYTFMPLIRT